MKKVIDLNQYRYEKEADKLRQTSEENDNEIADFFELLSGMISSKCAKVHVQKDENGFSVIDENGAEHFQPELYGQNPNTMDALFATLTALMPKRIYMKKKDLERSHYSLFSRVFKDSLILEEVESVDRDIPN